MLNKDLLLMSGQDDKCFFTVRSYTSDYSTDLAYGFDLDENRTIILQRYLSFIYKEKLAIYARY